MPPRNQGRADADSPPAPKNFNPMSFDAQFARLLAEQAATREAIMLRFQQQDEVAKETLDQVKKTNGRVTALERWRDIVTAKVAVISMLVSVAVAFIGWLISFFWGK